MIKKLLLVMFMLTLTLASLRRPAQERCRRGGWQGHHAGDLDRAIEDLKGQYGESLPKSDTPEYTELQKQVAERLVNEEILWFEAEKMNLGVTDDEINGQTEQYKEQSGGEESFNQKLQENNTTSTD